MYSDRKPLYAQLENERQSKVLLYVTGDRPGMETQIHSEVLDMLVDHLDTFAGASRISLILHTRGGDTLAAWTIANLIRQFCDYFEVIVPMKAHSAGTLITLGAENIVMTKQATLGPIDPSINTPLNPQIPGGPPNARVPVSVEEVAAFFDFATEELGIQSQEERTAIYLKLAEQVHPLALGSVYRARTQIQRLAERLLRCHMRDQSVIDHVIAVLSSESGSHDYTINRREARDDLHLPVETPSLLLYELLKRIHDDCRNEMLLTERFDPNALLGTNATVNFATTRALVESVSGGSYRFVSEGVLSRQMVQTPAGPMPGLADQRTFEGWKYER